MSVLIKGMEMPKEIEPALVIDFCEDLDGRRYARFYHYRYGGLTDWHEILELHEPHGRLIDADELLEHVWRDKLDSRELIARMIDNAPTIIPADVPDTNDGNILTDPEGEVEQSITVNFSPTQYQIVKQIDLTQDSIEQIADAVVRKLTAEEGET